MNDTLENNETHDNMVDINKVIEIEKVTLLKQLHKSLQIDISENDIK